MSDILTNNSDVFAIALVLVIKELLHYIKAKDEKSILKSLLIEIKEQSHSINLLVNKIDILNERVKNRSKK